MAKSGESDDPTAVELNLETREQVVGASRAVEEALANQLAERFGVPVYQVPEAHETTNLRAYFNPEQNTRSLEEKTTVASYIPRECWKSVPDKVPGAVTYAALIQLPRSRAFVGVTVGKNVSRRDPSASFVFIDTYWIDAAAEELPDFGSDRGNLYANSTEYVTARELDEFVTNDPGYPRGSQDRQDYNQDVIEKSAARGLTRLIEDIEKTSP